MSGDITIKKSTYNKLIAGIIVACVVSAFLGGYLVGNLGEAKTLNNNPQMQVVPQPTQAQPAQPDANTRIFIPLDDSPVKGSTTAPVTMIEFSDFQCPFCGQFFSQTLPDVEKSYIDSGKVKMVYRDFPLENLHANAKSAALAAKCANEQGKFWEYHNKLFQSQTEWASLSASDAKNKFKQFAADLKLNADNFNSCLDSTKYLDKVNKDLQDGIKYGVSGTPTFFIGNDKDGYTKLVGAQQFAAFQQNIEH